MFTLDWFRYYNFGKFWINWKCLWIKNPNIFTFSWIKIKNDFGGTGFHNSLGRDTSNFIGFHTSHGFHHWFSPWYFLVFYSVRVKLLRFTRERLVVRAKTRGAARFTRSRPRFRTHDSSFTRKTRSLTLNRKKPKKYRGENQWWKPCSVVKTNEIFGFTTKLVVKPYISSFNHDPNHYFQWLSDEKSWFPLIFAT